MGNFLKKSKEKQKTNLKFLRIAILICVFGILCSAGILIYNHLEYVNGNSAYDKISSITDNKKTKDVDFGALKNINDDVVGWLYSEGTSIDYPIVLGEDNKYYLTHLFNKKENKLGSLFMDCCNKSDFSDKNTVIYGHHMLDNSMFGSLTNYEKQSYYDKFPTMILYTLKGNFTIEFFAGTIENGDHQFVQFKFSDTTDFLSYVNKLKDKSTFKSNINVKSNDKIITLSTCSYVFDNARFALYGKLVPLK